MYAQIVVLTYQPPDIPTYTYKIPKNLEKEIQVGQLVSVPFGTRNPMGIVTQISDKESPLQRRLLNKKLKPIAAVVLSIPILLPFQIDLLKWLSFYYRAPMINCLEAMLPWIPRRLSLAHPRGVIQVSPRLHPGGEQIGQTLVLIPSINRLPETLAKYPQAKNYLIYHNELTPSQRFQTWLKILSGNVDFVFGSRSAIFTPCPTLSKIIIYDEHDGAYKDERSPYYDTLTVAEKISGLTGCKIEIVDDSPRVTTYFLSKQTRFVKILQTGFETTPKIKPLANDKNTKVQIVSMLDEKAAGNKSPISDVLENYIKKGFQKNKKMLLFLNKKIESGHLYCRACKHNQYLTTCPETCPNCGTADIWFSSLNTQSLAALVGKIVPGAKVNIIAERVKSTIDSRLSTIDVATSSVFYKLTPQKYDLVAHVQTDSLLNITDYTSPEKLFAQITSLKKITKGLLLLQTYNPQNSTIIQAGNGDYQKFFQDQITQRKTLAYPPFAQLIKLILKGKKEENLEKKAQKLFDDLNQSTARPAEPWRSGVNGQPSTVSILGPYKSAFQKTLRYNIVLKAATGDWSLSSRERVIKSQEKYFEMVPNDWQIVVEPDSLN